MSVEVVGRQRGGRLFGLPSPVDPDLEPEQGGPDQDEPADPGAGEPDQHPQPRPVTPRDAVASRGSNRWHLPGVVGGGSGRQASNVVPFPGAMTQGEPTTRKPNPIFAAAAGAEARATAILERLAVLDQQRAEAMERLAEIEAKIALTRGGSGDA